MSSINIRAHKLDKQQLDALKAFLKALKIKFELSADKPYDKSFVEKIQSSRKDLKNGKGKTMSLAEFKKLCK